MADNSKYIQAQKFALAVGISTTDTSITLQSFNFPNGSTIASGDIGTVNYGTLEPGTTREEQISFTGFTTNADSTVTLTGVVRGLGFGAVDTYSEQSDLKVQHGAGSTFILSNTAAFYDKFVNKENDETINGTLSVPTPTSNAHAATKEYVDTAALGGSLTQDRVVQAGTAGESVAAGDLVYFDDTDNEWKKTDGTSATTLNNVLLGIAQGAGSDGGSIDGGVLTYGLDSNQTGQTVGVKLYASDTAGAIAESAGTVEKVIGFSKSATEIYFDPKFDYVPDAEAQAFLESISANNLVAFGGDGSDGALNVTSGTTTLDLNSKTVYNYTSITIASGATLTFSGGGVGTIVPVVKCQGDFINEGTFDLAGKGADGGAGGAGKDSWSVGSAGDGSDGNAGSTFADNTTPGTGIGGNGAEVTSTTSGAPNVSATPAATKNSSYFTPAALTGAGGGGGGGGTIGNTGTTAGDGGAGGSGGLGLVLEIAGAFNNTGTIILNGEDGTDGQDSVGNGGNSTDVGAGGGGGGGAAGSLFALYNTSLSSRGTITATGGAGGAGGAETNKGGGGGTLYDGAGGAGGSGGASFFSDSTGGSGTTGGGGGAGGAGADGVIYLSKYYS